eukprot:gene18027-21518_t
MLSGKSYFDFYVELDGLTFDSTTVRSFIYTKKHFVKEVDLAKNFKYILHLVAYLDGQSTTSNPSQLIQWPDISNPRTTLGVNAMIAILGDPVTKDNPKLHFKLFCIYLVLMEVLSIQQRSIYLPPLADTYLRSHLSFLDAISSHTVQLSLHYQPHIDLVDYKLFLLIAALTASKVDQVAGDLSAIFGEEVVERATRLWLKIPCHHGSLPFVIKTSDLSIDSQRSSTILLHSVKEMTTRNNDAQTKMYKVDSDFIRSILPDISSVRHEFTGETAPMNHIGTTFKVDKHWHSNQPIDPDAFNLSLKQSGKAMTFKGVRSVAFKRYADSLNDPKHKVVINNIVPSTTPIASVESTPISDSMLEAALTPVATLAILMDITHLEHHPDTYIKALQQLSTQLSPLPREPATHVTPIFQLIQKYLRFFETHVCNNHWKVGLELHGLAKTIVQSYDLANKIRDQFMLHNDTGQLDEASPDSLINTISLQMTLSSDTLIRNVDARKDTRVRDFDPDTWQVELLDIVDKNESALICAPTSSGKTFICFYAFEKVLKSSHDGVVVFVAPTKALVNQMYAQIINKYDKVYPKGSPNVVAGIFTRDWRKDIHNCQILITVPQCLEILFLSVMNVSFIHRVRYVIFDEVHMVSSSENGHTWERNLLLNPAPFLALSATIGNLADFHKWMCNIDPKRQVNLIEYGHRFNDLKLHIYTNDHKIMPLNPISAIKSRDKTTIKRISNELVLLADEALDVYNAMVRHFGAQAVDRLDPVKFFRGFGAAVSTYNLNKRQVHEYQQRIKHHIMEVRGRRNHEEIKSMNAVVKEFSIKKDKFDFQWTKEIALVLHNLKKADLLPAIIFVFDRSKCERLAEGLAASIESLRNKEREELAQKIDNAVLATLVSRAQYPPGHPIHAQIIKMREELAAPETPFFGDLTEKDIDDELQSNFASKHLIASLSQGVGVHHSGMDKNYLRAVEQLYRQKKIQVCFATGSLALGVNMPCRSVVFAGDSPYLNLMTYRQCAGRSGRRGLENRGNIFFLGISKPKVNRLVNGTLSEIIGNTVISPSLTLSLVCRSNYANKLANPESERTMLVGAVRRLIDRSFFVGEKLQAQLQCYFSLDYLHREGFINATGQALDLSGIVTHLNYLEPSNFVLSSLLNAGIFDSLSGNSIESDLIIIEILAHLFFIKESPPHFRRLSRPQYKNLPLGATAAIVAHNASAIPAFLSYISLYRDKHLKPPALAITHFTQPPTLHKPEILHAWTEATHGLDPTCVYKNGIQALSGLPNICTSYNQLKYHLPSQSFFSTSIIPVCNLASTEINSYVIDFYSHGNSRRLVQENALRQSDVFPLLRDWSLLLRTISLTLMNRQADHPITRAFMGCSERFQMKLGGSFPGNKQRTGFDYHKETKSTPFPPHVPVVAAPKPVVAAIIPVTGTNTKPAPLLVDTYISSKKDGSDGIVIEHLSAYIDNLTQFFEKLNNCLDQGMVMKDRIVYCSTIALARQPLSQESTYHVLKSSRSGAIKRLVAMPLGLHQVLDALLDLSQKPHNFINIITILQTPIFIDNNVKSSSISWINTRQSRLDSSSIASFKSISKIDPSKSQPQPQLQPQPPQPQPPHPQPHPQPQPQHPATQQTTITQIEKQFIQELQLHTNNATKFFQLINLKLVNCVGLRKDRIVYCATTALSRKWLASESTYMVLKKGFSGTVSKLVNLDLHQVLDALLDCCNQNITFFISVIESLKTAIFLNNNMASSSISWINTKQKLLNPPLIDKFKSIANIIAGPAATPKATVIPPTPVIAPVTKKIPSTTPAPTIHKPAVAVAPTVPKIDQLPTSEEDLITYFVKLKHDPVRFRAQFLKIRTSFNLSTYHAIFALLQNSDATELTKNIAIIKEIISWDTKAPTQVTLAIIESASTPLCALQTLNTLHRHISFSSEWIKCFANIMSTHPHHTHILNNVIKKKLRVFESGVDVPAISSVLRTRYDLDPSFHIKFVAFASNNFQLDPALVHPLLQPYQCTVDVPFSNNEQVYVNFLRDNPLGYQKHIVFPVLMTTGFLPRILFRGACGDKINRTMDTLAISNFAYIDQCRHFYNDKEGQGPAYQILKLVFERSGTLSILRKTIAVLFESCPQTFKTLTYEDKLSFVGMANRSMDMNQAHKESFINDLLDLLNSGTSTPNKRQPGVIVPPKASLFSYVTSYFT